MMSTLSQRILTALVLITFVLLGIWLSNAFYFSILTGIIVLIGWHEWARITGLTPVRRDLCSGLMVILMFIHAFLPQTLVLLSACLFWIGAFLPVIRYKNKARKPIWTRSPSLSATIGFMVLYPFWLGLLTIFNTDKKLLIVLLCIVAAQDTGAYFVGKRWGQRKLLLEVSPGKTWEGVIGGMMAGLAVIFISMPPPLMGISLLVVIFSVLGDLFESTIKRIHHVKDSGNLLPGHGGLLDRIDSLTAAVPFFALGCLWWL